MNAAIVGCGSIARLHGEALKNIPGTTLRALVDIRPENAKELAAELNLGEIPIYSSIQELAEKERIDVLHLCTPHHLHRPMAITGMDLGMNIFTEKPLGIDREDFRLLVEKQQEQKAIIGVCFQNRYNRATLKMLEILKNGQLGKIITARAFLTWNRPPAYYQESDWRGNLETAGGGALINQGIHTLDLLTLFMGKPVSTKAAIDNFHLEGLIEVEDTYHALIQYENGPACLYGTTAYKRDVPPMLEVQGEKGYIRMEGTELLIAIDGEKKQYLSYEQQGTSGKAYWGTGHYQCISDFYEAITEKKPYKNDLTAARDSFFLTMDIYQAAREAREIPFIKNHEKN